RCRTRLYRDTRTARTGRARTRLTDFDPMPRRTEDSQAPERTDTAEHRDEQAAEELLVTPAVEESVGVGVDDLEALFALEQVKGFGPQKFRELYDAGLRPSDVLDDSSKLPTEGKRGAAFKRGIAALDDGDRRLARARAVRQILKAHEHRATVLTY